MGFNEHNEMPQVCTCMGMSFLHLSAVGKKKREYDKEEHKRRGRGRCTVSPQHLQVHKMKLSEDRKRFSILMGRVGQVLDRHPEALEPMKTAMKFATLPDGQEPVLAVVQSRPFTEAPTASALLGTLAPIANILDTTHFETLVEASGISEAIEMFAAYLKTRDCSQELILFVEGAANFLYPPPPSSEARAGGFREMAVQTERESVSVGEVQEVGRDVGGVLNVSRGAIISQGVRESSVAIIFWILEQLIPSIQSEYISLNHLHFLCDDGISQIRIEDVYILTIPSVEVSSFSLNRVQNIS